MTVFASTDSTLADAIRTACDRIAPTWPLDQSIAVNPYWGWRQQPAAQASAALGILAGTRLMMPRAWFRAQWAAGRFGRAHLKRAAALVDGSVSVAQAIEALDSDGPAVVRLPLLTDLLDAADRQTLHGPGSIVRHQISQHCAAFFDDDQARWRLDRRPGLYRTWKAQLATDRALPWRSGRRNVLPHIAALPDGAYALIDAALRGLGLPPEAAANYLSAVLLDINGWAAWCAWRRWQAQLAKAAQDDHIVELLAIRLAWEWLLQQDTGAAGQAWREGWCAADARMDELAAASRIDWLLQLAAELAYQQPLAEALAQACGAAAGAVRGSTSSRPLVQAVFCIDVRSEPFRRALEAADGSIRTRGFAGFFGLPIAYQPIGSALTRPQLPGLLAPVLTVTEGAAGAAGAGGTRGADGEAAASGIGLGQALSRRRQQALAWKRRWSELRSGASSGFGFVEACGLAYAPKLVADSLDSTKPSIRWEDTGLPAHAAELPPRLVLPDAEAVDATADMLVGVLAALGLPDREEGLAPLVLLIGHGAQTANNPLQASLDCGACGGQSGDVNARVLAHLLNHPALRAALAAKGTTIPEDTHFIAGLHNTTTDDIALYEADAAGTARGADAARALEPLRRALAEAGRRTRAERAPSLGLAHLAADAAALALSIRSRANDWAQVRPEWGLADNAAFVVAPRQRTRGMHLSGRSFLHDYDHRADSEGKVLELIMTAPMVVTNWINLQYHASTVDNARYGSGNKTLHNVVGGRIGVFEGNGGDLRIGLALQSLHDGERLRHTPLRLSVFIEAPRAMIDRIVLRHETVRQLVEHSWLHLLRIDEEQMLVERWTTSGWQRATDKSNPASAPAQAPALV